jgi:hypothetical protein
MTRLILTTDGSCAVALEKAGRADIVIPLMPRLVWGPLPSDAELAAILAARSTQARVHIGSTMHPRRLAERSAGEISD